MGAGAREATVTAWEPPRRFAQEVAWAPGGDLPPARDGPAGLEARLSGEDRAEVAAREQPRWEAWLRDRFPAGAGGGR
jgi:hypothetical protein